MKKRDFAIIIGIALVAVVIILVARPGSAPPVQTVSETPAFSQTAEPTATGKAPSPAPTKTATPKPTATASPAAKPTLPPAEAYLLLSVDGLTYAPYPLTEETDLPVEQTDGSVNVIHVTPTSIEMKSSSCENQDCVEQGTASLENRESRILWGYVICLPNRVQLELLNPEEAQALWQQY